MSVPVVGLRRYPVKSMGGESLPSVAFDERGIVGDRWYAVVDPEGHFASGKDTRRFRRRDPVFEYRASTTPVGVRVERHDRYWLLGDAGLDEDLSSRMGLPVRVEPEGEVPHQDAGPVSIVGTATLEWCAARWGVRADPRRLRVNVVVQTSEPFVEETWLGCGLHVGTAVLAVTGRAERCRMIDIDQDGAVAAGRWLKSLAAERELKLAVYAEILRTGRVALGELVTVTND